MICIEAESLGGLDFFPLSLLRPKRSTASFFHATQPFSHAAKHDERICLLFFWLFEIREFDETLDRSLKKSRSATVMMLISLGMSLGMIQE